MPDSNHHFTRRLLTLFLPVSAIIVIGAMLLLWIEIDIDLSKIRTSESRSIEAGVGVGVSSIAREIQMVVQDLSLLENNDRFVDLISQQTEAKYN